MKLIIAIVKPFKLDEIRQKLADIGVSGITISTRIRKTPPRQPSSSGVQAISLQNTKKGIAYQDEAWDVPSMTSRQRAPVCTPNLSSNCLA